jgi:hypothetical protein
MITCITVSTKYDNILNIILPQNYKFFKKWYIITDENDRATIDVIKKYNFNNVEIVYFDFYKNATFNKGGAIRYVQEMIDMDEMVLLLDSDIFIPDKFICLEGYKFKYDTIYSFIRYDYYTYQNFIEDKHDDIYDLLFMGFFQLYKNDKTHYYKDSENCKDCDYDFQRHFIDKKIFTDMVVKHLGKPDVNHYGRDKLDDFIM